MKTWMRHGLIAGAALAAAGLLISASGVVSIKASSGHWPATEWLLRFSMKRSIATHSLGVDVPPNLDDPALIVKGARHYEVGCRFCHGEPGLPPPPIASAMLPRPPELAGRIRASDPKKLFYVVKHGIKLTGMPAWPSPQRDDEVWAMVAFLLKYPGLDAEGYRTLARPVAAAAHTPGDAAALARSCAACHDQPAADAADAFPRLAGQRAAYLRNTLEAYASGRRHSGIMQPLAAGLTPEVIAGMAEHFSRQPPVHIEKSDTAAAVARGRAIALEGLPARRVPACVECHGPGARRGKPEYPSLAGQPAGYLESQLALFKAGQRGGTAYAHLMNPVASRLTDDEARDVAAYFASLPPGTH